MLRNYIKIAFRNMKRHKGYSFINIAGLAVGIACTIIILLWVQDELSFDRFHENADQIHRIVADWEKYNWDGFDKVPGPLAHAIKEEIPAANSSGFAQEPGKIPQAGRFPVCQPVFVNRFFYPVDCLREFY